MLQYSCLENPRDREAWWAMVQRVAKSWTRPSTLAGEGNGTPLQYSCLENPMDGGAWWATVHGVAKSQAQLSNFTFTFHFHALEKEVATHSSILAWRIPGTEEPSGLPSMGLHRVALKLLSNSSKHTGTLMQLIHLIIFSHINIVDTCA